MFILIQLMMKEKVRIQFKTIVLINDKLVFLFLKTHQKGILNRGIMLTRTQPWDVNFSAENFSSDWILVF